MPAQLSIVKIERGTYSPYFQVARAWLSAASALVSTSPAQAITFIDSAMAELKQLRQNLEAVR